MAEQKLGAAAAGKMKKNHRTTILKKHCPASVWGLQKMDLSIFSHMSLRMYIYVDT